MILRKTEVCLGAELVSGFLQSTGCLRHSEKLTTQSRKDSVRFDFQARFLELLEPMRAELKASAVGSIPVRQGSERGNSKTAMVV